MLINRIPWVLDSLSILGPVCAYLILGLMLALPEPSIQLISCCVFLRCLTICYEGKKAEGKRREGEKRVDEEFVKA
jgi:hypothetical protein